MNSAPKETSMFWVPTHLLLRTPAAEASANALLTLPQIPARKDAAKKKFRLHVRHVTAVITTPANVLPEQSESADRVQKNPATQPAILLPTDNFYVSFLKNSPGKTPGLTFSFFHRNDYLFFRKSGI